MKLAKVLRYLAYGLGGIVLLAALAVGAALAVVDGAFVKARLEGQMKERNRTLQIEGVPRLTLFPVASIALGKTTLSEPGGDKLFLALDSAEVALRVMPLLRREIALETLKLAGLRLNLVRAKDGRMNFADLAGESTAEPGRQAAPRRGTRPRVRIAGMDIDRIQIAYRDEASGQELNVGSLVLKAAELHGDAPAPMSFTAHVTGRRPDVDLRAQAEGAVRLNLAEEEIGFERFSAQLKGRIDRDTLSAEFAAPKVEITPAKAAGSAITGNVKLSGPQRNLDVRLKVAALEGSAAALSIPSLVLDVDGKLAGLALKANAQAAVKANLEKQTANVDLSARLDESSIAAKLALAKFRPLTANFSLNVDRINLDRYFPPQKEASSETERIDLAALWGPAATGKVEVGALTVRRMRLSSVKAEVKLADGKLEVAPYSASLYGGTLTGSLALDANGNKLAVKEALQGVQIGPLLHDLTQRDRIEARANVSADVTTSGPNVLAMKKALAGTAKVDLRDGAVKGFNLTEAFENVKSVLGSKSGRTDQAGKRTEFSEITASFAIKNGVARNDDLQGKAPLLRIGGAGEMDIPGNRIDYVARVTPVATSKGQGGRDLTRLAGVTIPVRIGGTLDLPDWSIDYGELIARSGAGVVGTVGGAAGSAASAVGQKIRGLFGR